MTVGVCEQSRRKAESTITDLEPRGRLVTVGSIVERVMSGSLGTMRLRGACENWRTQIIMSFAGPWSAFFGLGEMRSTMRRVGSNVHRARLLRVGEFLNMKKVSVKMPSGAL
jgi:hypothetical protein